MYLITLHPFSPPGDPTVFGNLRPAEEAVTAVAEAVTSGKHNGYGPSTGGRPVGRRWDAGGTQVGGRWEAGGMQVGRRWDAGGTQVGRRWDAGGWKRVEI